jgi:hypothetical protein
MMRTLLLWSFGEIASVSLITSLALAAAEKSPRTISDDDDLEDVLHGKLRKLYVTFAQAEINRKLRRRLKERCPLYA